MCIGYKKRPPPVRHNYTNMPDEEYKPHFEPSVLLDLEEFTTGLGFKPEIPFDQAQSVDAKELTTKQNQDPPVIVEDAASSDDEYENEKLNYILCDPPIKPAKTVMVESTFAQNSESVKVLYTLIGYDSIYSNKDFPIKNVNQSLISKVFRNRQVSFWESRVHEL
ncbi:hypothetical protein Hanom_Chr10g00952661 [Helianthus anomalus]